MHRIRQAASWIPRNFRYLPLAAAWPLVVYYAGTGILGIAGWAAILLAAGAWYAGADFLCKFAEREPASYVGRNLLWVPLRVLWPACAALFIAHVLTNTWPAFLSNLAAAAAAFALYGMSARAFTLPIERHHRGAERSDRAPTEASVRAYGNDPRAVWWGGILLPGKAVTEHTAFVGVTGSGKTLSIKLFLQQLLPQIRKGSDCRALIYDADQEMIPYLTALQRYRPSNAQNPILDPEVPIITLNPYDERGYAWDIAADVTTDATAIEVASLLFPGEVGDQDPFFTSAAQQVLRHIMMAFHYNNDDRWTFKELVDTFRTEEAMRCALESCPLTAVHADTYLTPKGVDLGGQAKRATTEDRQARGIVATIANKIAPYQPVADLWAKAPRRVSLKEWSEGAMVLLLGAYDARTATLSRINQVLFNLAAKSVLSQEVDPEDRRRSFFVLDEVRRIRKLEQLDDLLTNGRKHGAGVILGFQDIEGMRHAYHTQIAHEVIAQCSNIAFLKVKGETARWAESFIQSNEGFVRSFSDTGKNLSVSESLQTRSLVLASELTRLPKAGSKTGLQGWYMSDYAEKGVYPYPYDWHEVIGPIVTPEKAGLSDLEKRGFIKRSEEYYSNSSLPQTPKEDAPTAIPDEAAPGRGAAPQASGDDLPMVIQPTKVQPTPGVDRPSALEPDEVPQAPSGNGHRAPGEAPPSQSAQPKAPRNSGQSAATPGEAQPRRSRAPQPPRKEPQAPSEDGAGATRPDEADPGQAARPRFRKPGGRSTLRRPGPPE